MNKLLLEYRIKEQGFSINDFCKEIGISRSSFYKKCKGEREFKQSEIKAIVECLKLDSPMDIFFAN